MKAGDLRFSELIHYSDGQIDIASRRLLLQDFQALGQLQRDLIHMFGWDQSKRVITRYGYFWGQSDASSMQHMFHWDDHTEIIKTAAQLLTLQGVAKTNLEIIMFDVPKSEVHIKCMWTHSGVAEAYLAEMSKSQEPVCWLLTGYMSGYATHILGKSVYFIEDSCVAAGASLCSATGKDIDTWGSEIKPHIEFFHTMDIQGSIERYTRRIEEIENKLVLQKSLLDRALTGSSIGNVEIKSLQFQQIILLANKVAKYDSSVLLTGETGVGKDLLARHIYTFSPRSKGPFVAINCAALTDTLLESELFGHKAGSFTGATRDKRGLFEEADGGVIFLDEIGDISPAMQSKLLRVLQEREILRVGDTKPVKVDFRLISATNRDLEKAVSSGLYREDLFYRLQVIHIIIPPLRERREDIPPLARYFVEKQSKKLNKKNLTLDSKCIDYLLSYSWPGNIRELENAIEHAAIMCPENVILPEHFPVKIIKQTTQKTSRVSSNLSLETAEFEHIRKVLAITNGNREEAAKILKIGIATLYRKLAIMRNVD
ncbi:MAG: sigma 54-interacting transcriptional regulator [Candidatus Latescibacteria bacterium]|nr:sigma 54-interacting transcriptional regulator [Candidatus Latescibacterota bacterium]